MSDAPEDIEIENATAYPPSIQAGIPKLGQTPKGWTRYFLGDLLRRVVRPAKLRDAEAYQLVTAKRSRGGIVARETLRGDQIKTKTQFYVEGGDFLISNRQVSHGACGIVPESLHCAVVSNEYTAFRTSPKLDLAFLNALSHSVYFQQTCFHSSIGVHVEKLVFRLEDWMGWEFDVPPLDEQRRIVAVLETWDRAIAETEQLIDAKRRRWRLLVGELRQNRWKPVALGKLGRWVGGGTPSKVVNDYWQNGDIPWVSPKDMTEWQVSSSEDTITARAVRESATQLLPAGSVLVVTRSGILRTKVPVAVATRPVSFNQDIKALVMSDVRFGSIIAALIHAEADRLRRATVKTGTTVESIDLDGLKAFQLRVPEGVREVDIAHSVVVGGLQEIDGLEKQLDRLRTQRRGLMQKLLTGGWRLDARFDPVVAVSLLAVRGA
ncbi:conserved hypothetical protein [Bosea sp. 62]|uniref:restriction endonuclease subunit S n=1 Tax=unclassified Bosea (in: a-proteobacteria) TaxID=2653178 RepID=UPI001256AA3E|nr:MULTISPECIES: restriction endonuclease subunit S [unclassified Bosea (in: a-proteobacteria)]CAD5257301.1 conserved hypothetical protein [Bosea sp. 7B]CAD5272967.1 conserved hypothetical protein [Bosea sp. 21B]CAD5285150.1 conserved hypothetical protein [Bosea sp. 46]VVT60258.1 conserved hypothetical protein [Bosea sp. EC-HK365B]VXB61316.1 conserved hypothetical protein [Bosea sp. 62]